MAVSGASLITVLFERWEEARQAGYPMTVEELCREHPNLIAAFRETVDAPAADRAATTGAGNTSPDIEPGDRTADARPPAPAGFELVEEIGRGGMGVVYRARDLGLGRDVAVKVLLEHYPAGSRVARRFVDEALITGQLQHPGIPPVYQVGTVPDGRPFLAMKLIKGRTLADLLAGRPAAGHDLGRFLAAFEQVCQAVAYAHAHGVIHRDLKPANVMIGAFGEVQVMDWGLAKVLPAGPDQLAAKRTAIRTGEDGDRGTRVGEMFGTPAFMPPEQAIGAVDLLDARADVFGLGGILCVILTGRPPYTGENTEQVRQRAVKGRLDGAHARLDASGADADLVALCKRCLSAERDDRPRDAGEVAAAAAAYLAGVKDRARQAELEQATDEVRALEESKTWQVLAEKTAEERKRRQAQFGLAAAVGLLVAGAAGVVWWEDRQATGRLNEAEARARDERAGEEHRARERRTADEARARAERDRQARNAAAVAALLDRCEEALRADDAARAALALDAAEKRSAEGGTEELAGRLQGLRADLGVLHDLDRANRFRWARIGNDAPDPGEVAARVRKALGRFGADPAVVGTAPAAGRVSRSAAREQLITALDRVLWAEKRTPVREVLRTVDPDRFRDAARDAVLAGDTSRLAELAGRPEAEAQPPGFAAVLGDDRAIAVDRRKDLLTAAVRRRPGSLGLLLALCYLSDSGAVSEEWAPERIRWAQAAVAVAPAEPVTRYTLATALYHRKNRDLAGAEAEYREAIRLDPAFAPPHLGLGRVLAERDDLAGAEAEYREAVKLDPADAPARAELDQLLRRRAGPGAKTASGPGR